MSLRRKGPTRPVFPRKVPPSTSQPPVGTKTGTAELTSYLSYALLILYVLASVSATKDEMLLIPSKGIQLPLVTVTVSVTGFYFLSPIMVLIGHLITLRRIPTTFSKLLSLSTGSQADRLSAMTDRIMLACLLLAGPVTLLLITYRFAAFQSPLHLVLHATVLIYSWHATVTRYVEVIHGKSGRPKLPLRLLCEGVNFVVLVWLLVCVDVTHIPAEYSRTLKLKRDTTVLTDDEGGTVWWVPHITIDKATQLWSGRGTTDPDLVAYSGKADAKQWFMSRGVALDVRARHLRFLDISYQVLPRVWAQDADLSGANLSYAKLYGSQFADTQLSGANFSLTGLDGATFMSSVIEGARFNHTDLRGTYWDNVTLRRSQFLGTDLSLSVMYGVTLDQSVLAGVDFTASTLSGVKVVDTAVSYVRAQKVMRAEDIPEFMDSKAPVLVVAPTQALVSLAPKICRPKPDPGWEYAWETFMMIKSMTSGAEPEVVPAVAKLFGLKQCAALPQRDAWLEQARAGGQVRKPAPRGSQRD